MSIPKIYILLLLCFACNNKKQIYNENNTFDLNEKRRLYIQESSKIMTKVDYAQIHKKINDSLKNWARNGLVMNLRNNTWQQDSLLCFNSKKDKFISSLFVQLTKYDDTDHDGMYFSYGVKIKSNWYFLFGPYIVISRNLNELKKPVSFENFKKQSMQIVYSGYLKKNKSNEWEINDRFFDQLDYRKWGFFDKKGNLIINPSHEQADSALLQKVFDKWNYIDTTDYSKIVGEKVSQ